MPVIALNFKSFEAKRNPQPMSGEIKINSTPKILDVQETTLREFDKKAISLSFEFVTSYEPDIGTIRVEGDLIYTGDKAPQAVAQWAKKKSVPEDVSVEILNHLFRRCLLKISVMAEDLQLPPPLNLPRVQMKDKDKKDADYIG